jgi:nitrous oxidase accessory protein NosD
MNRSEFRDAIDRHGEDLAAWPPADRDGALALLTREPASRCLLDRAAALRTALRDRPAVRAPAGLADRIVRAALGAGSTGP